MMISEETIAKVREANDILEVVSESVPNLKRAGKDYKGLCPFHQEKTPSFFVSPSKGIFHCFGGCGKGGDVFKFVMEMEHCTYPEAIRKLAERKSIPVESGVSSAAFAQQVSRKKKLLELLERSKKFYHAKLTESEEGREALRYLTGKRQLKAETIERFQVGWAPAGGQALIKTALKAGYSESDLMSAGLVTRLSSGKYVDWFRGRVVFPIFDLKGQVLGFGGRILELESQKRQGDPPPKYLNSPETETFQKGKNLYGLYHGSKAIRQENEAVVMEGYMDAIASHQAGVENAVAPLGTSLTADQCQVLKRYAEKVTLLFDSDAAGEAAALRGAELLLEFDYLPMVAQIPGDKDADEFLHHHSAEEYKNVLRSSISFVEFKIQSMMKRNFQSPSIVNKIVATQSVIPLLLKVKNEIVRSEMIRVTAKKLDISESSLHLELKKAKEKTQKRGTGFGKKAAASGQKSEPATVHPESYRLKAEEELLCLTLLHPQLRSKLETASSATKIFLDSRLDACYQTMRQNPECVQIGDFLSRLDDGSAQWLRPRLMRYQSESEDFSKIFESILARIEAKNIEEERKTLERQIVDRVNKGESASNSELSRYHYLTQTLKGTEAKVKS